MTHNQLEAERAFYQMQAVALKQKQQQEAQPLWEMKSSDNNEPIVISNVDYIRVYQPLQQSANDQVQIQQYRQMDYISPWTNLIGKIAGIAIPAYAAYKVIDSVASNSGEQTYMNNYGANSQQSITGDTSLTSSSVGGNLNLHSDFTHDPLIVRPDIVPQPDPIIVNPVVVDPVIVE